MKNFQEREPHQIPMAGSRSQGVCVADLGLGYSQIKEAVTLLMLAHNECLPKRREEIISILTVMNIMLHRIKKLRTLIDEEDLSCTPPSSSSQS